MKKYEINGKTYIQQELQLGQIQRLGDVLQGVDIPDLSDFAALASLLGNIGPKWLSAILVPEGMSPREVDYAILEKEMESCSVVMAVQAVRDFFVFNPPSLLFSAIKEITDSVTQAAPAKESPSESQ